MQKFITLDGLNRNLKDFYANIVKPEIKKNAGTGSNNVALIENNKIIGGSEPHPYGYQVWINSMSSSFGEEIIKNKLYTSKDYNSEDGGNILMLDISNDGSRLSIDYGIVTNYNNTDLSGYQGMLNGQVHLAPQTHAELDEAIVGSKAYPPGNFVIKATVKEPSEELVAEIAQNFPEIKAILSPRGTWYSIPNLEEITPEANDLVLGIQSDYYYCSLGEMTLKKEQLQETAFYYYENANTEQKKYQLYNNFIIDEKNTKLYPPEENTTSEQLQEKIAEVKSSLIFYTKDFNTLEEIENDKIKQAAKNTDGAVFAFVNGTIYGFQKSDNTWFQLDYFAVDAEGEECSFVYPMEEGENFTLPAVKEIISVTLPTDVEGDFKFNKKVNLLNANGEHFISTFLIKSQIPFNPEGYTPKQFTFSIGPCSDEQLQKAIRKMVELAAYDETVSQSKFNEEKFNEKLGKLTWESIYNDSQVTIYTDRTGGTGNWSEYITVERIF